MTVVKRHDFHIGASADSPGDTWDCGYLLTKVLEIACENFTGKVTPQGSYDGDAWLDASYVEQGIGKKASSGAISLVSNNGRAFYTIPELWPKMRVNVTRTTGGVTIRGFGHEGALTPLIAQTQPLPAGANNIGKVDPATSTLTSYNITCAVADTQHSQALPANTRAFEFQARTEAIVRYAFVAGKVAEPVVPYHTLKAGDYYCSPAIAQGATPSTLYIASPTAGTVVELLVWT